MHYAYRRSTVQLGQPGRDKDIETYQTFLRDLGKLGIPVASYDFHPANTYTTAEVERRGYTPASSISTTSARESRSRPSSASTRPTRSGRTTPTS